MSHHNDKKPLTEAAAFDKEAEPAHPDVQNPDAQATGPRDHHQENQPKRTLPRKAKRHRERRKALFEDALKYDRQLKRAHRAYWKADPKAFRADLKRARGRVFHLKCGPKKNPQRDARIAAAARERAGGAQWVELYPGHIEYYAQMSEYTRHYAEAGFQKEVNRYLRKHPRLRRKFSKKTVPTQSTL